MLDVSQPISVKQNRADHQSVSQIQTQAPSRARTPFHDNKPNNDRGGFKKPRRPRKPSVPGKSKAASGMTKKHATAHRRSSSSFNFGHTSRGGAVAGGAAGGIGMMPL